VETEGRVKLLLRLMPWFFVALFGAEIVAVLLPRKEGEWHTREFGSLPVLLNGRIQPFDSVARNSLLQIRSTGDLPLEITPSWQFWHHPKKLPATDWLLEVMARPEAADARRIFLIHHADLLGELKLQGKGVEKSGLHYFSYNELTSVLDEISDQGQRAGAVKAEDRDAFQKQGFKLANALNLYRRLKLSLQPEGVQDFKGELAEFQKNLGPARSAAQSGDMDKALESEAVRRIAGPIREFQAMAQYGYPLIVPPLDPVAQPDGWQNAGTSLLESFRSGQVPQAMEYYATMATAYQQGRAGEFNSAVAQYRAWLQPILPKAVLKGRAEFYFNRVKPFLHATIIYLFAFVLACVGLVALDAAPRISEALRRSAFSLVLLAGTVHTAGLVFRMVLEGRPPVTNLYSSAIFIGWGTMVFGVIIERIYRVGLGSMVASLAGFVTLLIAHNLAMGGDTMEMMRAVLDNNFWLATHVVVITLGYAATFFAGLLAILYILLGLFTPLLARRCAAEGTETGTQTPELGKTSSKMVYGVVCFATLFSFVGTVLGGIWADQSWGRFWGWDPKENGALLIVLWNAILLHARWGGLVRERGLMNLAVFGNIVTSFSWFGVNMLGIGLHSYGFMDAAFQWLQLFIATQIGVIAMGLIPLRYWRSFSRTDSGPSMSLGSTISGGRKQTQEESAR
jgi:cytochrome c-type biogenesis protein CcsB